MRKGIIAAVLVLVLSGGIPASAEPAEDISGMNCLQTYSGAGEPEALFDMQLEESRHVEAGGEVTLENEKGIGSIYLIFDREYDLLTLTNGEGRKVLVPVGGILHTWLDVEKFFGSVQPVVTVTFPQEAELNELRVFSPGEPPDWVQKWQWLPDGEADLMLFSTHGDDEQLFFAGLLPWYGAEQGKNVQVVYFTDHRNLTSHRVHEMLNGLWAVGIRNYPVFGEFSDYYTFDLQDARRFYEGEGYDEQALLSFLVEQLRRFRPSVAVGHDMEGEYGHGMHKLYANLLCKAAAASGDAGQFPESAAHWGAWDVPKTYLHLYPEGEIIMDWDIPLSSFGGKTAYQVSRDLGFAAHVSQQKDFSWFFRGYDRAIDVEKYSPCRYGLYRSTVGGDMEKNDLFEHVKPKIPLPEPTQEPEPILPPLQEIEQVTRPQPMNPTEKNWLAIPAAGTLVLTVMTAWLNAPREKEIS